MKRGKRFLMFTMYAYYDKNKNENKIKMAKNASFFFIIDEVTSRISPLIFYDLYTLKNFHFQRYPTHFKFIEIFRELLAQSLLITKLAKRKKYFNAPNVIKLFSYIYAYDAFFNAIYLDIFEFLKTNKDRKDRIFYYLIMTFTKNRLFVNFLDIKKRNYVSISPGLFIKFFEKKKSLKKTKTIKLLIAKFLRKLLLLTKIKYAFLIIKKTPIYLIEILNMLNQPILHKFIDPHENEVIEEKTSKLTLTHFTYLIFLNNTSYVKNKLPLKGRVKRKIFRKIILENNVID